jgi:excinuclease UvrABC nuclease subunit
MVPQIVGIEALVCASEHEAAWAERMLLEHRKPRWNRVAGGLENPVYVRLDISTPSIAVVHEPVETSTVRCYGPYLGGTATRLAVAAIERAYPLAYTRSGMTGTERDLARLHGVGVADAELLVSQIDLVLRGDPWAVSSARELLVSLRDEASGSQLYERAARIQEELGGLEWVGSPVRFVGTVDLDLCASVGGQRVSVTLRGGRLQTWDQAPSTEDELVAPVAWHDFLQRNATLAAALASPSK